MSGTNSAYVSDRVIDALAPAVILVRPQLGENIGMCARAMLNCGVTELRIVSPRDGWPNPDATASASGAVDLLEKAKVFETVADAVADLEYVLATSARQRDAAKDVITAEQAGKAIRQRNHNAAKQKCGILFGPERTGLENDDMTFADAFLNIPLNPGFSSLNLAQAVLLVSYSWLSADNHFAIETETFEPAPKDEVENFLRQLEDKLTTKNFFRSVEQKPTIMRNLRHFFFRSGITSQETRTLHGIIKCLMSEKE